MKIRILVVFLGLVFSCSKRNEGKYETKGDCFFIISISGNQDKYHPPLVISTYKDTIYKQPLFNNYLVSRKDFEKIRDIIRGSGLKGENILSSDKINHNSFLMEEKCNSKLNFSLVLENRDKSEKYINYLVREFKTAGINEDIILQVSAFK